MRKATSVEMRESLELVNEFKKARIKFVPIPVINDLDYYELIEEMTKRLSEEELGDAQTAPPSFSPLTQNDGR